MIVMEKESTIIYISTTTTDWNGDGGENKKVGDAKFCVV
jgi:hypothetical protein